MNVPSTKGRPFLELFASALNEDYRFPVLEIFVFLYALSTFVFASFAGSVFRSFSGEATAYTVTSSVLGFPLFIFVILILKNIAYGLGNDLEKGIIQTFLSYPIKRRWILSAKLLSALGIATLLVVGVPTLALYVLAPDIIGPHLPIVMTTFAANLSFALLTAGIVLLVTLAIRRGGLALVLGIVFYFALQIFQSIVFFITFATRSALAIQILAVISPSIALGQHFSPIFGGDFPLSSGAIWTPGWDEVLAYIGAGYVVVISLFLVAYLYFSRRLSL